ncbi:hypothetical protein AMTRI_Chr04g190680 [Amborella trichopoda]|uniref:SET domain-containing protein n=1 Tax=Amborella trichopoda TaxID=13333 RepID=W1NH86_AMBTC|nr:fructose-bisphosphate aldolase-lysine N-methyltransferase, chloroplastic [Amborella trichopoda]ERM94564.1 hypothetical protein AMTR_s00010p00267610 [Amborella trichopoda]|eukprot:XP_006827327.1 fructose-bisphosphate aldolase-lysine N-methyltransferase, chloroplastic [Amborella trichopoda]
MAATISFLSSPANVTAINTKAWTRRLKPSTLLFSKTTRRRRSFITSLNKEEENKKVERLWKWGCEKGGAVAPAVRAEMVETPHFGLGLVAKRSLSQNQVVLEVPKKLWINSDTVAASEIGRVCGGLKPWISVALFIITEEKKKNGSPWCPYLDILPQKLDSPLYWSEEELTEIQGTQLLSTTLGVKEYVQSEFSKVEEEIILPNKHLFPSMTVDDFLWAFGILRSRAFSQLRGKDLVLVPLADLINHSCNVNTEDVAWQIKGSGLFSRELVFSLRTPLPVNAGEQVFIQYDLKKSNAELALDYGFIEPNLGRDAYSLTLEIPESDPFFGDKLDIAESNGFGETAYFNLLLDCGLPEGMLPYLRLAALGGTDAFLLESIFRNTVWGHLELPVSQPNEEFICKAVADACRSALSLYRTTIEEDEELLKKGKLELRLEIAVGVRLGEKKVLNQILKTFEDRGKEVEGLEYYQERRLKDLGLVGEQGEIIFWES